MMQMKGIKCICYSFADEKYNDNNAKLDPFMIIYEIIKILVLFKASLGSPIFKYPLQSPYDIVFFLKTT